ncbi:AsmA family protein [Limoniibacter endophyticus]|uniref:AsmA domain-containing protein n=1 Tax=Limoniibacter endophyticus TaxID=1565040 RepID=A0A8J3GJ15_9HYPH|nr:AsmA family protein [Limoniibacter endophyticus]GHC75335.1 hypothetical protein GCM10010136_25050 [Limoniibacter endophyticus]
MTLIRIFVTLGSLVVLLLAAALVVPYFVDWNAYRAEFEREASLIVGREVRVEGETQARLLPFPSVSFKNVTISGDDPAEPAMTADAFSMDAELAPLINGSLHIFDMRLERPRFRMDVASDGSIDWMLRPETPVAPSLISVEKLTISDGTAIIAHAPSRTAHMVTDINAQVSARTLSGPWRIDGRAVLGGQAMTIGASTGTLTPDGTMRLQLDLHPNGLPWSLSVDGTVAASEGRPRYTGNFRINGGAVTRREGQRAGPSPYRFSGPFMLNANALATEDFRFETGTLDAPYTATGTARLTLDGAPSFEIRSDAAQFQLAQAANEGEETETGVVRQRLRELISALGVLPVPTIPGRIDISLPAVVAGDTTVRDVRFSARPQGADWRIETLQADLPGRARLEASGDLEAGEGSARFAGHMVLAIQQPAGFVEWATGETKPQARRLRATGFEADVSLAGDALHFSNTEIVAGSSVLRGNIAVLAPGQETQTLTLDLESQAIDLEQAMALTTLLTANSGATRWGNADVKLRTDQVTGFGLTAAGADVAARMHGNTLEIDRLQLADFQGAALAATGKFEEWMVKPEGEIDATVTAADLAPAIETLARTFPQASYLQQLQKRSAGFPGLFADARLDLVGNLVTDAANSNGSSVALSGRANLGGSDMTLTGSASGNLANLSAASLSLNLSARNEKGERVLALAGLPVLPLDLIGEGEMTVNATGQLQKGMDAALDVVFDDLSYRFAGAITRRDEAFEARGRSELKSADLSPYLVTAGIAVPGASLTLPLDLTGGTQAAFDTLSFFDVDGTIADNDFSGSVAFDLSPSRPLMTGNVKIETLDLGWLGALAWGDEAVSPFLAKEETSGIIAAATTSPWDMRIDVQAQQMTAGPLGLNSAAFKADVSVEQVALTEFQAKAGEEGTVSGAATLSNVDGVGGLQTQLSLDNIDLTPLLPWEGAGGAGTVSVAMNGRGRSVEDIVASLSGSGTVNMTRFSIAGLSPNGLADAIRAADDMDQTQFGDADFAVPLILRGAGVSFTRGQLGFTISEGLVRAPSLALEGDVASISGSGEIDLRERRLKSDVRMLYENVELPEGASNPPLRLSLQGAIPSPQAKLDTSDVAQFLTLRAVEREEARVAEMQALLLEKQRLRREASFYRDLRRQREEAPAPAAQQPVIDGSSIERLLNDLQPVE